MESFLQLVARDLYGLSGGDLSGTAVVFPGKRAALFFGPHLAREAGERPLWAPTYTSISELLAQLSPLRTGDTLQLVCELYQIYQMETGSDEPLDDFYSWGELLVSDFDDVDKNLVQADRLFTNLHDLKAITEGSGSFLTPEQEEVVRHFFQDFSTKQQTELRERFITLWEKMGNIYHRFQDRLRSLGIAYEGMMYRDALERLNPDDLPYERYAFVGFNVLNRVEHELFERLQQAGRAVFYWDYDTAYVAPQADRPAAATGAGGPAGTQPDGADSLTTIAPEAGLFMRENLRDFPNRLPAELFHHLDEPKRVTYISAPTENAQARYVASWIRGLIADGHAPSGQPTTDTAIVLCNESLLLPVLHALPTEVRDINITMGFPLIQTQAYSFLHALLTLHVEGYRPETGSFRLEAVNTVLRHPFLRRLSDQTDALREELEKEARFFPLPADLGKDENLAEVFTPQTHAHSLCIYLADMLTLVAHTYRTDDTGARQAPTDTDPMLALEREAVFMAYTLVGRLGTLLGNPRISIQLDTLRQLLGRVLDGARVPFHGEPAVGVQVMGVLETRTLDFRHVLLLSAGEGNLPKAGSEASFIPYNLRKAFGMTTLDHRNAVYAYYFYRLMQRAERVTLTYNSSTNGINRGEMSRFMLQYLVHAPQPVERRYLQSGHLPEHVLPIEVEKTPEIMDRLRRRYDLDHSPHAFFSPSALNAYLDCRLKFYLNYVARLRPKDRVTADVDTAMFGTLFHAAAEQAYRRLMVCGTEIRREDIERLLDNDVAIQSLVDQAFRDKFFHLAADKPLAYTGTQLVIARVIATYVRQLLQVDLRLAPIHMESPEQKVTATLDLDTAIGPLRVEVGGIVDRMDIVTNRETGQQTRRIIDYKTGGSVQKANDLEQVFTPHPNRPGRIFQTFLYADIVSRQHEELPVSPCLLLIHRSANEDYSPVIEMGPPRKKKPVHDFAPYRDEFRDRLRRLLEEIFDPAVPFAPCEETDPCELCHYRPLCKR